METTTIFLATDPDYYGQDCTQAEANEIAAEIQRQVRSEYGSEIEFEIATVGAPSQSSGPLVDEISEFIQNNWIDWI